MKTAKLVFAASALALAFGSAWAGEKDKSAAGNMSRSDDSGFAKMDKNKDGYISKSEAKGNPAFSKDFAKRDMNSDGKLNRAEYLAAAGRADVAKTADKVEKKMGGEKSSTGSSTAGSPGAKK